MPHPVHLAPPALVNQDNTSDRCRDSEGGNQKPIPTHRFSFRASCARNRFLDGVFSGARHAGDKRFVARDDVDEKVELVGLAECLGNVGARQSAAFVGVSNDECPCCNLCDENF